jgi:hypothetical protein
MARKNKGLLPDQACSLQLEIRGRTENVKRDGNKGTFRG